MGGGDGSDETRGHRARNEQDDDHATASHGVRTSFKHVDEHAHTNRQDRRLFRQRRHEGTRKKKSAAASGMCGKDQKHACHAARIDTSRGSVIEHGKTESEHEHAGHALTSLHADRREIGVKQKNAHHEHEKIHKIQRGKSGCRQDRCHGGEQEAIGEGCRGLFEAVQ